MLLVTGSFVAAWYLRGSLREAETSREAGLRPVLIVDEVRLSVPEYLENESVFPPSSLFVRIRNVGPGPALGVDACDCAEGDAGGHPRPDENLVTSRARLKGGFVVLAAGEVDDIHMWPTAAISPETGPATRLHLYYKDVFGNVFRTPIETQELLLMPVRLASAPEPRRAKG